MKNKKTKKTDEKMVVMIPTQTFGFERKAYAVGERYIMAKKDLPTVSKGMYKIQTPQKTEQETKQAKKAKDKKIPVTGK
ncbi:MAG: hypothetical protein D6822_08415 [Cyanobacteria bacterium J149]|nr:MAG: hypothetical protein D6822_08415 [Cyanobacteria bacterium J149]